MALHQVSTVLLVGVAFAGTVSVLADVRATMKAHLYELEQEQDEIEIGVANILETRKTDSIYLLGREVAKLLTKVSNKDAEQPSLMG